MLGQLACIHISIELVVGYWGVVGGALRRISWWLDWLGI